ncbi:MAG: PQQ-like beta-propeller repeat protein [Deltaproteobacteria bacterium]|nr:PQQ-like beta-propeller repeat protein [Candidatus Zymogenaceae bacterium]
MRKTLVLTAIAAVCIALVFIAHTTIVKRNSPVSEKWCWCFKTFFYCSPVVAGDMVYVAYSTSRGYGENCLYAINRDSGELEWEYCEDDAEYFSSPSVADGVVYTRRMGKYSDDRDYLYAVDAANGTMRWRFELGDVLGEICASPTVVEGIVYVKSTDTLLYAVDAQNGELLWQFETEEFIRSSAPAAANGVVCITTDNYLYAIDTQSGELNWQYMIRCSPRELSLTVADDAVYMVTIEGRFNSIDKGRLYAIDIVSGEKRWEYECEVYGELLVIDAPPSVVDGMVFLGATHIDGDFGEYVYFGVMCGSHELC